MDKGWEIRQFTPQDVAAVIEINDTCLPEHYTSAFFLDLHNNCPEAFQVAEADGRVVGYVMCRLEHGFSEIRRFRMAKKGHLVSIAVIPTHRRVGVGKALVTRALEALWKNRAEECFLEVRVSNEPAVNLYKKLGFNTTRRVQWYYSDGEDAYVMCRDLRLGLRNG